MARRIERAVAKTKLAENRTPGRNNSVPSEWNVSEELYGLASRRLVGAAGLVPTVTP